MWKIEAQYQTGDSFGRYDAETILPMEWGDIEAARAALKRIEEHWRWYEGQNKYGDPKTPEPKWHKGMEYDFCLKLILDNGEEVQFSAPWCGYFERLYGARIFSTVPSPNEIDFR